MINWRAVVATVLLNAALINAAVIGFAAANAPTPERAAETSPHLACDNCLQRHPG